MPGVEQLVHHPLELVAVQLLDDVVDAVHVPLHHAAQNVPAAHLVAGHLDALDGRELTANQLLQLLLHIRVAVIAQLRREAHHGGLADLRRLAQLTGGHEGRLIVVFQNIIGDTLLSLGERIHAVPYGLQNAPIHVYRLPLSFVFPALSSISTCQLGGRPAAGRPPPRAAIFPHAGPVRRTCAVSAGSCPDGW